jgi:hypothetical protein
LKWKILEWNRKRRNDVMGKSTGTGKRWIKKKEGCRIPHK